MNYAALLTRPEHTFDQCAIDRELDKKVVLVTGAGGSIGSALVRRICTSGVEKIVVLDQSELPIFNLVQELNFHRVVPVILDAGSEKMTRVLEQHRPDVVIHAAAHKHVGLMEAQPDEAFRNNTLGTISLAEKVRVAGIKKFIFISTDKAARPTSNMGASKRLAEVWLTANFPQATIVRFGNVLGSSGSLVEIATKKILAGEPVPLTDLKMVRYFITPTEAVGLVLTAGLLFHPGAYVLDMGRPVFVEDVIYRVAQQLGKALSVCLTRPGEGEKLEENLLNPGEVLTPTEHGSISQISGTIQDLNYVDGKIWRVDGNPVDLKSVAYDL